MTKGEEKRGGERKERERGKGGKDDGGGYQRVIGALGEPSRPLASISSTIDWPRERDRERRGEKEKERGEGEPSFAMNHLF